GEIRKALLSIREQPICSSAPHNRESAKAWQPKLRDPSLGFHRTSDNRTGLPQVIGLSLESIRGLRRCQGRSNARTAASLRNPSCNSKQESSSWFPQVPAHTRVLGGGKKDSRRTELT